MDRASMIWAYIAEHERDVNALYLWRVARELGLSARWLRTLRHRDGRIANAADALSAARLAAMRVPVGFSRRVAGRVVNGIPCGKWVTSRVHLRKYRGPR